MPQSLHHCYGHLVFSTKDRFPSISGDYESRLYEYMGGIVKGLKAKLIEINGTPNHVHVLIRESKAVADQEFIGQLKGESSRWVNENNLCQGRFGWQDGYGWFSVSPADLDVAATYVRNQKEHHKKLSFEDEFRQFLNKYKVEFDERYVWD